MIEMNFGNALVTGGAGYIGSHLVDALENHAESVTVVDDFSNGSKENLAGHLARKNFKLERIDLRDGKKTDEVVKGTRPGIIFHLAAEKDIKLGEKDRERFLENNVAATLRLLEACRKNDVEKLTFASTSAVYGNATVIPTPEEYGPLLPISVYGASKLACEAFCSAYADNYGMACTALRFSNVVGGRQNGGVIFDFVRKLRADHARLEILGDGKQTKNYLHVNDCAQGILAASEKLEGGRLELYNIASKGRTSVDAVADCVMQALKIPACKPKRNYTGKSWLGDVKVFELDARKLETTGWKATLASDDAVCKAAEELAARPA